MGNGFHKPRWTCCWIALRLWRKRIGCNRALDRMMARKHTLEEHLAGKWREGLVKLRRSIRQAHRWIQTRA
jgi:hypothetical protein